MIPWLAYAVLAGVLVAAAVTDCRAGRIPNWLTYPAILVGLAIWTAASLLRADDSLIQQALLATFAGLVPFAVLVLLGGLGGGDAKLMGAVGAICGDWLCVLHTALFAVVLAAVMAVVIMVRHGLVRRTLSRIGAALLTASARVRPQIPEDSPRVPFALAICIGGLVAALPALLGIELPAWLTP